MRDNIRVGSAQLFPTDHPISAGEMIGREQDVDAVAMALLGGGNVILAGPRRTGKTTVADAAIGICRHEGAYVAAVDLFDASDLAALAHKLSLQLLANLGAEIEITLELARAEQDPTRALAASLALLQRLAGSDDRHVVVFFDEFQDIASKRFGDPETLTRQLRSVLQRSPRVSVLFAGSIEHLMRDLFAPTDRALSQFGSFHELAAITPEQWTEGLRRRLELDRTTIADDALARLIELGEAHPRATMLIAQQAHLTSIEELRHTIDNAMVVRALDRALIAERLRHEQQIEGIRASGRYGERMAVRVAVGTKLYDGLRPQQAARALRALHDNGIIDHGPLSGHWFVVDPLLRRYLTERAIADR